MFRTIALLALLATGCAQTTHDTASAELGAAVSWSRMEQRLGEPGPIELQKVVAANWEVPLEGLLNLDHPEAQAAGLTNRPEPIQIYFYALRHPDRGTFLVDTGIARSIAEQSDDMPIGRLVRRFMNTEKLDVQVDTRSWLHDNDVRPAGVLMTHLHLDHVLGLQDIPKSTPIYVGPGESEDSKFGYLFTRSTTDANLDGFDALREFRIEKQADSPLGVIDVLGDGSLFGLHIPGHTAGSMAYLVRTTAGPALLTGDGCHTSWGWQHGVEPGQFSTDGERSAEGLAQLRAFAKKHPELSVHLGHQPAASEADPAAATRASSSTASQR